MNFDLQMIVVLEIAINQRIKNVFTQLHCIKIVLLYNIDSNGFQKTKTVMNR